MKRYFSLPLLVSIVFSINAMKKKDEAKKLEIQNCRQATARYSELFTAINTSDTGIFRKNISQLLEVSQLKTCSKEELEKADQKELLPANFKLHKPIFKLATRSALETESEMARKIADQERLASFQRVKNLVLGSGKLAAGSFALWIMTREIVRPLVQYHNVDYIHSIYFHSMFPAFTKSLPTSVVINEEGKRIFSIIGGCWVASWLKESIMNFYKTLFYSQWCEGQKAAPEAIAAGLNNIKLYRKNKKLNQKLDRKSELDELEKKETK